MVKRSPQFRLLIPALVLFASSLTCLPTLANDAAYRVEISRDAVLFHRANTREQDFGVDLVVTGPADYFHQQHFNPNQAVYFSVLDAKNQLLADGRYNFELRPQGPLQPRHDTLPDADSPKFGAQRISGVFTVNQGVLVSPDSDETPQRDQVITDDQIVQGSLCVGTDCVNNEGFDFDTIRLKENNVRIRFFDTSNSSSFPSTDWQLTANDSTNGGANRFSIEDFTNNRVPFTVEGNAPDHSLFVDDSGRVGLGTSTPILDVHVASGNTPGLRLDQDASQGFPAQIWDIGGNESELFIRDTTSVQIPLRIIPGAPSASLHIAGNGDIGLGSNSPAAELHLQRNNNGPQIRYQSTGTPNRSWHGGVRDSDGDFTVDDTATGVTEMIVRGGGNVEIAGTLISMRQPELPKQAFTQRGAAPTLDDVARYIAQYQQLPGLEQTAAERGQHDVLAFQMKLLEKIQELTVYTLQQEQRIKQLEQQLQQQKGSGK